MDQINLLIQKYNIPTEENLQQNSQSNDDSYYYLEPNTEKNNNNNLSTISNKIPELENSLDSNNNLENNLNNNLNNNIENNDIDNSEKPIECLSCNWKFPSQMNLNEINIHINDCLDGKGEENRLEFEKTYKLLEQK